MLKDILGGQQTAQYTLMLPVWSIVLWKLARKVSVDERFLLAGFILLFVLAHNIVMSVAKSFLSSGIPAGISVRITILEAFYTATLAALCYRPLKRLILS